MCRLDQPLLFSFTYSILIIQREKKTLIIFREIWHSRYHLSVQFPKGKLSPLRPLHLVPRALSPIYNSNICIATKARGHQQL